MEKNKKDISTKATKTSLKIAFVDCQYPINGQTNIFITLILPKNIEPDRDILKDYFKRNLNIDGDLSIAKNETVDLKLDIWIIKSLDRRFIKIFSKNILKNIICTKIFKFSSKVFKGAEIFNFQELVESQASVAEVLNELQQDQANGSLDEELDLVDYNLYTVNQAILLANYEVDVADDEE